MKKVYVASSWRNVIQGTVVQDLREAGFEVYDFRHPTEGNDGFQWEEIDHDWQEWGTDEFVKALKHPTAQRGFKYDMNALAECDACVLLLPCGRSAHLEAGYAVGAGKKLCILNPPCFDPPEPELMYKMADIVTEDMNKIIRLIAAEPECQKPLTLEELMEMTREPVYNADDETWYVIDYVDIVDELSTLIVMTDSTEFDSEDGLPKFYRTNPTEVPI